MKTILIGKPYTLRWMVNTNGHQSSLSGRDIKLYIITPKGVVVCADGHWHASDNNIVLSLWQDFQYDYGSGCYALKAVENEGKDGESCFVINPAFAMTHNNDEVGDDGEDAEGNIVISVDEAISIADIVQMTTSTESEGENVIKVVLTDGRVKTFVVRNGKQGLRGLRGLKGNDGDPGEQGDSGISEEEKQTLLDAVEDINEAILEINAATQQASKVNAEIVGDKLYVTNKYGVTKSYQLLPSGNEGEPDVPSGNTGSGGGVCECEPYDDTEIRGMIAGKQATISDLEAIRTGAAAGATALQPVTGMGLSHNDFTDAYKQKVDGALQKPASNGIAGQMLVLNNEGKLVWQNIPTPSETPGSGDGCTCTPYDDTAIRQLIAGKQDVISDLATIRTGAAAGATALQKPSTNGTTGQMLVLNNEGKLVWQNVPTTSLTPSDSDGNGTNNHPIIVSDNESSDLDISDENGNVILRIKNGHIMTRDFDSSNIKSSNTTSLVLSKRRSVVSFSFDDNPSNDMLIKQAFDECGAKCGFAIIESSTRYKDWYKEGYEILAHGSSFNVSEEEPARQLLISGKNVVESLGIPCYGFVTPQSQMNENLRQFVYDYFEYGFTQYKGDVSEPSNAIMTKEQKSYNLWRTSIYSLSIAQCKAVIDKAVEENAMVHFYTHSYDIDKTDSSGETHSIEKLKQIVMYAKEKSKVLTPVEACREFYAYRFNED